MTIALRSAARQHRLRSTNRRRWLVTGHRIATALTLMTISLSTHLTGQDSAGFFDRRTMLELTIRTDLATLLTDRSQESQERPAEVEYVDADGNTVVLPTQIKTRGSFRLDPQNCDFPPLRLNFRRRDVPQTIFADQDQLKMVTHCGTPDQEYQQFVVLEYLVYRVYELLTPRSFRTRLAHITYEDASGTYGAITRYAFFLEDVVDMANRNNARLMEFEGFHSLLAHDRETSAMEVFQYLIGNTDWSVFLSQNVEFLEDADGDVFIVPFDFDWSGAVAPPYAVPAPDVPVDTVRERFFMGACRSGDPIAPAIERFKDAREAIYSMYRSEETLSPEVRDDVLAFYDGFFDLIADARRVDTKIRKACIL